MLLEAVRHNKDGVDDSLSLEIERSCEAWNKFDRSLGKKNLDVADVRKKWEALNTFIPQTL